MVVAKSVKVQRGLSTEDVGMEPGETSCQCRAGLTVSRAQYGITCIDERQTSSTFDKLIFDSTPVGVVNQLNCQKIYHFYLFHMLQEINIYIEHKKKVVLQSAFNINSMELGK